MADRVGQQLGNYRLLRLLGRGGFAEVYLGEHIYLKSQAAIKVMHARLADEDMESFLTEARTVFRLTHPQIVRVLDFGVEDNTPFLVMDYAPNGTLRQRHPKGTIVPLATVVDYVKQVADALQYAHDQKLVHRDIKPENLLLGRNDEVLLSDFGIAIVTQTSLHQGIQDIAGTIEYMAPEQLQGHPRPASDQYALGVIVYEWLSGERPFHGSFLETASQQSFAPPTPLREMIPTLSPTVESVVMTALAKDSDLRFVNVKAFATLLELASSQLSPPARVSMSLNSSPQPDVTLLPSSLLPQLRNAVATTPPSLPSLPGGVASAPDDTLLARVTNTPLYGSPVTPLPFVSPTLIGQPVHTQHSAYLPTGSQPEQQRKQQRWKKAGRNLLLLILTIFIVAGALTGYSILSKKPSGPIPGNGIGVSQAPDGEYIGISDGTFAFDTNRPDGNLKLQAADKLKAHDISAAQSLWQSAVQQETDDAEALIYLEDQRVLASGHPHITFVVGTILTRDAAGAGRQALQGAYVAQKEFNDGLKLPGGVEVRLLIASSGNQAEYATTVAQQVVQAARVDKTVVGVMGWLFGSSSLRAITVLGTAHIPMVSTADDDFLTGISHYFFRIVPSVHRQAVIGAQYAEQTFQAKKVALFVDPNNMYSEDLAASFEEQFFADGNTVVATEKYTVGQANMLPSFLQDALNANPDLIYFAGYADDVKTLLAHLPTSGPLANIQVLGGEALYEDYHSGTRTNLTRLHFTASAYSDEWNILNLSAKKPLFFTEHRQDFYPNKRPTGGTYINPSTGAMLSYDATLALLIASSNAFAGGKKSIMPGDLREGLTKIIGSSAIQGASGQISFGPDGDPVNKAVVLLYLDPNADARMESVKGTFLVGT